MDNSSCAPYSETEKSGEVFQRSPLKDKNSFTSEKAKTNIHSGDASDSKKLQFLFNLGIEVSKPTKIILNSKGKTFGSPLAEQNSRLLRIVEQSSNSDILPEDIFGKQMCKDENTCCSDVELMHSKHISSTFSEFNEYRLSGLSYHVLVRKICTDFLYFQELSRTRAIKNVTSVMDQGTEEINSGMCSSSPKSERGKPVKKLKTSNLNSFITKETSSTNNRNEYLDINHLKNENFKAAEITYSFENQSKYFLQTPEKNSDDSSEETAKSDTCPIVTNKSSIVNNEESTGILHKENSKDACNLHFASVQNFSTVSRQTQTNELSKEVSKSSINSNVMKDPKTENNLDSQISPDNQKSNFRHFESLENRKYVQESIAKKDNIYWESVESNIPSTVTTKTSIVNNPDSTTFLDDENSNVMNRKDSRVDLESIEHMETLDLKGPLSDLKTTPPNEFNAKKMKLIFEQGPSISTDVSLSNSSITGKETSKISDGGFIPDINIVLSNDQKNSYTNQVNDSKASVFETEAKDRNVLQHSKVNDGNMPSIESTDYIYGSPVMKNESPNPINLNSTMNLEGKDSKLIDTDMVPTGICAESSNPNGDLPIASFKVNEINVEKHFSTEKTLSDVKNESSISSDEAAAKNHSSEPSQESAKELCYDFLHFKTKLETSRQHLADELLSNMPEMLNSLKHTEDICRKIEDLSDETPRDSTGVKVEFSKLHYLIASATKPKLSAFFKNVCKMQKDLESLHTCLETYNTGIDDRLARILNIICSAKEGT
ncbi:hypothetical protein NPIL_118231 [Nephila pilipes]|uniref:Uncharacterized protein n=1 Tax=Nephila pilipes TaxID=299642 RepID=A0A8X6UFM9_NEPPI|nr:hypothetical protein NPIL_118231 [Nephila pilipes]